MGLLDTIFSESDRAKRYVKGLLGDPFGVAQQAIGNVADNTRGLLDALRADPNSDASYQGLMALAGAAPVGMTVWHGSPHKFTKFDMSKIGTGEGAQAYGHGLYLAETEDVAKRYRDTLTNFRPDHIEASLVERGISPEMANTYAQFAAQKQGGPRAFDDFASVLNEKSPSPYIEQFRARMRQEMPKLKDELGAINGHLYKTDIPDEAVARFLDWDKPLSQQWFNVERAKEVAKRDAEYAALKSEVTPDTDFLSMFLNAAEGKMPEPLPHQGLANLQSGLPYRMEELTGKDFYGMLARQMGSENAAQELRKLGVPGIRYLDQGSRLNNVGTSNFVTFDPDMIRILERNGQATGLQPWKPGEWNPGLLGGM